MDVRIKICGITREQDAVAAVEAGADAIGLVFADSLRRVTIARARQIAAKAPPFVAVVGVFVNARPATVARTAAEVGLTEVQLHGDESAEYVSRLDWRRVLKAVRVRDRKFVESVHQMQAAGVSGVLLEAFSPEARGGSGRRFDWDLVVGAREAGMLDGCPPIILAGGLTPQNVASAVRRVRPWGVDVSTGVETEPGVKSAERISRFIAAIRAV